MPSVDVLRDWQAQEDYFFASGFTWTYLAIIVGIVLLTWLLEGHDQWRHR